MSAFLDGEGLSRAVSAVKEYADTHITDITSNPHQVTLGQAATRQGTEAVVLPENSEGVYEGVKEAPYKLITRAEAQAEFSGALNYKGQLKYGAMTVTDMNAIEGMNWGDMCGVQETQLTYVFGRTSPEDSGWIEQPLSADATGDLWDMLFWYGTWVDGHTYHGDVTAQIKCQDGDSHTWDLLVLPDRLLDGEVTDNKIGNRTLEDHAAEDTLVSITEKDLTGWLQGIRDNLKALFEAPRPVPYYQIVRPDLGSGVNITTITEKAVWYETWAARVAITVPRRASYLLRATWLEYKSATNANGIDRLIIYDAATAGGFAASSPLGGAVYGGMYPPIGAFAPMENAFVVTLNPGTWYVTSASMRSDGSPVDITTYKYRSITVSVMEVGAA
jgi:hypothetical protein